MQSFRRFYDPSNTTTAPAALHAPSGQAVPAGRTQVLTVEPASRRATAPAGKGPAAHVTAARCYCSPREVVGIWPMKMFPVRPSMESQSPA